MKGRLLGRALVAVAAVTLTGAQALPAMATTAFADAGTCTRSGTELRYTAEPGVDNDVTVRFGPANLTIVVEDQGGEVVAGTGCTAVGDNASAPAGAITRVRVTTLNGDDTVHVNVTRPSTLRGGDGEDALFGGPQADDIGGGNGEDDLRGLGGDDVLSGGAADDIIRGGDGNDTMNGNGGNDDLRGGNGDDELNGATGDDELNGGAGNDELNGGAGVDELAGKAGNDELNGGSGNDELNGGANTDDCNGGPGNDTVVNCE
ncbi:calcium-binding protein [Nonomuraea sp. NPDC048916]|uniref:calcium-binding protein n=1 Tax=Nonomuraea sp. NPDC048916 TaxID=3154232 RepID=UPI00340EA01B